jgi:hypothetical protein
VLELHANMDLYRIIGELKRERDRIHRIIQSLEGVKSSGRPASKSGGRRRGRKSMDAAARAEVSARMKRYWEERRAQKEAAVELPTAAD